MLLTKVKQAYTRYLTDPSSDPVLHFLPQEMHRARQRRTQALLLAIENARPFSVRGDAFDLIATMPMEADEGLLGQQLDQAPLPFSVNWVEFTKPRSAPQTGHSRETVTGMLLVRSDDGSTNIAQFLSGGPEGFFEPYLQLEGRQGEPLGLGEDPFLQYRYPPDQEAAERRSIALLEQTVRGLNHVLTMVDLISSKGGPLSTDEVNLMFRQERRRLERGGKLPSGPPPTVTRIRINDQGRQHLQAIADEEGGPGGVKRRAHRVRGHFMETLRGRVWRRAHVRGFGPINETVRDLKL